MHQRRNQHQALEIHNISPNTGAWANRERNAEVFQIFQLLFLICRHVIAGEPALWNERMRLREDRAIVMQAVHGDGDLSTACEIHK